MSCCFFIYKDEWKNLEISEMSGSAGPGGGSCGGMDYKQRKKDNRKVLEKFRKLADCPDVLERKETEENKCDKDFNVQET